VLSRTVAAAAVVVVALVLFRSRGMGTPRRLPDAAVTTMDWLRGLAALAVLFGHVRGLFMQDFEALRRPSLAWKAFYVVSGFGHQAVIVFFILSGFLVGSTVLTRRWEGTWAFGPYLARRLARLYVVLVPGLLLTAAWDLLGMRLFGTAGLYGGIISARHLDLPDVTETLSWGHFLGNLAFLQHLFIQPFGSNNPLWSLSYEFWAYLLFPTLLRFGDRELHLAHRTGYVLLVGGALALGGWKLSLYFGIWLMGAAVALWWRQSASAGGFPAVQRAALWLAFGCGLLLARSGKLHDAVADLQLGLLTALVLAVALSSAAARSSDSPVLGARAATRLASFSYTLYVSHYPVLTFLFAGWMTGGRWSADRSALVGVLAISLLLTLYALVLSRLTEAHTDRVRMKLSRLMRTS
jgi:peptidoglycan/LPS O-acetylase OafA/YrhL